MRLSSLLHVLGDVNRTVNTADKRTRMHEPIIFRKLKMYFLKAADMQKKKRSWSLLVNSRLVEERRRKDLLLLASNRIGETRDRTLKIDGISLERYRVIICYPR